MSSAIRASSLGSISALRRSIAQISLSQHCKYASLLSITVFSNNITVTSAILLLVRIFR
ncbi:MAG: hypothetical protein ABI180_10710 [Microcoleus sp.]